MVVQRSPKPLAWVRFLPPLHSLKLRYMKNIIISIVLILLMSFGAFIVSRKYGSFFESFLSNLLSSGIIAIVFGIFIFQFTELTKKPVLSMVIKQGGVYSKEIKLTKLQDGNYETNFRIAIQNSGNKMLKPGEGYWHFYVPGSSDRQRARDLINLPIFQKSFLDIDVQEFKFKILKEHLDKFKVYYFFETSYGYFPNTTILDQQTGVVKFENIAGEIKAVPNSTSPAQY